MALCLFLFLPDNASLVRSYYDKTFDLKNPELSTKTRATLTTYTKLPKYKPYQKYIGLGPGQYCSKASMILSDTYLSSRIPAFMVSISPDLKRYIIPIWMEYKSWKFQPGSTYFPFYSWLSLYSELGVFGCAAFALALFIFFKRMIFKVRPENFILILGLLIVVLYIFLLGIQDNYWEWAQFILPIVIYAKVMYYMILNTEKVAENDFPA